jgi:threonine/homoserine/homoserine lactone efflux protein
MTFPLLAFLSFAIAASVTPGPNNVMVAASAASHGVRAVVPQILGISLGFGAMILIVGLGLAVPLASFPQLAIAMRWIGAAWLALLAWKIATAPPPGEGTGRPPLRFIGGALFQWINPKAWMLAVGIATTWAAADAPLAPQVALMAAIFALVGVPNGLFWAALGERAGRLLHSPGRLRIFNVTMALLLLASMIPVLLPAP